MTDPPAASGNGDDLALSIRDVAARPLEGSDTFELLLQTSRGEIRALLDVAEGESGAVVYCNGAMGGPHEVLGPGDKLYQALARTLVRKGLTSPRSTKLPRQTREIQRWKTGEIE